MELYTDNLIPQLSWAQVLESSSVSQVGDNTLSSGSIYGLPVSSLSSAIDSHGNLKGDITGDLINARLDTSTKEILSDFTFGVSGSIKIITDANNGTWLSPTGILGKKSGVTTFALTSGGDLTMKGTLLAGSVVACNISANIITAGTLTGRTVRTSSSTTRVEMSATGNELILYQNGYERTVLGSGMLWFGTTTGVGSASIYGYGTNTLAISTGSYGYLMNETQFYPMSSSASLGTSSYPWLNFYVENIRAPSASDLIYLYFGTTAAGYLSYNSGVQVNAAEFLIDCPARTRAIFPKTANTYACGGSGLYWSAVYSYYYYAKYTSLISFDKHDDIRLLKSVPTKIRKEKRLEGKKEVEKDVEYFDLSNIPEVKGEEDMVDMGAVSGLLIGTLKQLVDKVEILEDKIKQLENK